MVVYKLHEDVMNHQRRAYFVNVSNDLLCVDRKNYSCQSVLVKMVDDWEVLLDNNHIIGVIFMDLPKAFDCLPHGLFTAKLRAYGSSENACDLIASYLSNRYQRVKSPNSRSDWRVLRKGVPARINIGPATLQYVCKRSVSFRREMSSLQLWWRQFSLQWRIMSTIAPQITQWFIQAQIKENIKALRHWPLCEEFNGDPPKFQFMVMSNDSVDKQYISLSVNESILKPKSHVNVLVCYIDERLTFNEHMIICCSKAARQFNALSRISMYLDISSCSFMFKSFVKSYFNFCPLVWHFGGKVNNGKIEKIQQRALKIIYNVHVSS